MPTYSCGLVVWVSQFLLKFRLCLFGRMLFFQRNAVAHILYGGNTLLAHAVGAGKPSRWFRRRWRPNGWDCAVNPCLSYPTTSLSSGHRSFTALSLRTNILQDSKARKLFETQEPQKVFAARYCQPGNYDPVIIGHSQFEKNAICRLNGSSVPNSSLIK